MLTLALESSAKAASVALVEDGSLVAQYFQNSGLTHSRTLMEMASELLINTDHKLADVGLIAVARGPGSFTGIRIGVAAAKGLAWAGEIPCAGVSTLGAMAFCGLAAGEEALICAAMDARRGEIYNALFEIKNGAPVRLTDDRAIPLEALAGELAKMKSPVFVLGDGAALTCSHLVATGIRAVLAPENTRWQTAWGVAMAAAGVTPGGADSLTPEYLRLSQAERERRESERGSR